MGGALVVIAQLRRRFSSAAEGVFALLRLLPRVNRFKTWWGLILVLLAAVLPVAMAVVSGVLIGGLPLAVRYGLHSAPGRRIVWLLVIVGCLVVLQRIAEAVLGALAQTLGREVDQELQQR